MSLVDTVKNGMVILNFKDNSPVMLITELSDLHLGPVEPVVLSVLLGIGVLEMDRFEFTLVVVVTKGDYEIEVTLDDFVLDVDLDEGGIMGVAVLMLRLVMVVVFAHFFKRLYLLRKDSKIYIGNRFQGQSSFMVLAKIKIK